MWGTHIKPARTYFFKRFIPTHVGNTPKGGNFAADSSVHPHACGEHEVEDRNRTTCLGSSPRMWGTQQPPRSHPQAGRFIPTHVGNTDRVQRLTDLNSVHPHACGEHLHIRVHPYFSAGSSPRMWGTLPHQGHRLTRIRFIPTHVGNTPVPALFSLPVPVHPHACGEHCLGSVWDLSRIGSSPRMWGTHFF